MRTYISIITLKVKGLNAPTKRHRLAEWIQKQDPYICCLQETHFTSRDTYKLKVRGWKKIFHANEDQKKAVEWFTKAAKQGHEEAKAELEFYNRRESENAFEEDGFFTLFDGRVTK